MDIWLNPTQENGKRFYNTLLGIGLSEEELEPIQSLDFTQPQVFGILGIIEVLTQVHQKLNFNDCFTRSRTYDDPRGVRVHFLHINDLRQTKVWARRDQDLRDIIQIDDFLKELEEREKRDKPH